MRARFVGARAAPALVVLLGLLAVPGAAAPEPPAAWPILGVDPLKQGTMMEDHACALRHWVEQGISDAVLLHIDTHDDFRTLRPGVAESLNSLRAHADLPSLTPAGCGGTSDLFNEGNFVRAAVALGVVKEVVWVVPFTFLSETDAGDRLQRYLRQAGFSAVERESFRLADGFYRGVVANVPLTICVQEHLPHLGESILLSIDADFFPFAAFYRGFTALSEIRALFSALREARYAVRDVVLSYSVQDGYLPVGLRWIGEAVVELLRDPSLVQSKDPPERWKALQQLALLKTRGEKGEAELLDRALELLANQPHDPALLLYAAEAVVRHGGDEKALTYAVEACKIEKGYCVGLREIGLQLLERGNFAAGSLFFAAGDRLLPGMRYGQLDKGMALVKIGRTSEAMEIFEEINARAGAFPVGFVIGALQELAGDRKAARLSFDKALAVVESSPYISVTHLEIEEAVKRAAAFYREEGLFREAGLLENDSRLRMNNAGEGL